MISPLVKGIKLVQYVVCPHCHLGTDWRAEKCSKCSEELSVDDSTKIYILLTNTGAIYEPYAPFVRCSNCRRLLEVELERCPDCYEELEPEYKLTSAHAEVMNTIACDIAAWIDSSNAFALIIGIGCLIIYGIDFISFGSPRLAFLTVLHPVIPLIFALLWFYRFAALDNPNDEYFIARHKVKRSLYLWLAILATQLIVLTTWYSRS